MNEYFKSFVDGDLAKKVSMISDVTTILGVSVATFVVGPLLDRYTNFEFILSDFILSITFYFIFIVLTISGVYSIIMENNKDADKESKTIISKSIQILLLISFLVISFPYIKYIAGNLFNVSYLLPTVPKKAILGVENLTVKQGENFVDIYGKLKLDKNIEINDYIAIVYVKNKNNLFVSKQYGKDYYQEYEIGIDIEGSFNAPISIENNDQENIYIVVYRKSDWTLINKLDNKIGYPTNLTSIPHTVTDEIGAFVIDVKAYQGLDKKNVIKT